MSCGLDVEPEVVFREGYKQKVNMKKLQLAIMAAALLIAIQAHASFFDITFTGVDGTTFGSGVISGTPEGGGLYQATAGYFTIIPGSTSGLSPGIYPLFPNPNPPNTSYSPSGFFYYDNQVLSQQDPFLTSGGLLFLNGVEINLFSTGGSPEYQLYENTGANVLGSATLTAVPEATTMIAGALLLLPLGASTLRILRKSRMA